MPSNLLGMRIHGVVSVKALPGHPVLEWRLRLKTEGCPSSYPNCPLRLLRLLISNPNPRLLDPRAIKKNH